MYRRNGNRGIFILLLMIMTGNPNFSGAVLACTRMSCGSAFSTSAMSAGVSTSLVLLRISSSVICFHFQTSVDELTYNFKRHGKSPLLYFKSCVDELTDNFSKGTSCIFVSLTQFHDCFFLLFRQAYRQPPVLLLVIHLLPSLQKCFGVSPVMIIQQKCFTVKWFWRIFSSFNQIVTIDTLPQWCIICLKGVIVCRQTSHAL